MPPSLMDLTPPPQPPHLEHKDFVCGSNFDDDDNNDLLGFDQEVDVIGIGSDVDGDGGAIKLEEQTEDADATEEQSTSFGNTFSGSEDEARLSSSDADVESQHSHFSQSQFFTAMGAIDEQMMPGWDVVDGSTGRISKKKKVTAHWRKFIGPLMWRCHWLELRMNELHSQASLYDKELAAYKREKQLQSKMIELGDSVSRTVPLSCQRQKKRAMKRRRRKRIEETVDISSYMSNHHIFSYYENKRSETDCQSVDSDRDIRVDEVIKVNNDDGEGVLLGLDDGDDSLEKILLNLDSLQSRVISLKTQLSEVMCTNSDSFSAAPSFLQEDPHASYSRSRSCSPGNNGYVLQSHHQSEHEFEMPGSAVSSFGEATDVDMIKSTAGLLSADYPLHQNHGRDLYTDNDDDVLISNQAGEELKDIHGGVKLEEVKEEAQSCSEDAKPIASITAPGLRVGNGPNGQLSVLKPCYTGKKRGRKPKRKRRGGCTTGLRSERIQRRRLH